MENLRAVDPAAAARDALRPVALRPQHHLRGEAGGLREAGVLCGERSLIPRSWAGAFPAAVGRRGPGEDAHHHVEGEKDLRQTNPDVQDLLIFAKAADGSEDLVEIHRVGLYGDLQVNVEERLLCSTRQWVRPGCKQGVSTPPCAAGGKKHSNYLTQFQ